MNVIAEEIKDIPDRRKDTEFFSDFIIGQIRQVKLKTI